MAFSGVGPVAFSPVSMVTATLGPNDAELGTVLESGGYKYVFVFNGGTTQISPGLGCCLQSSATQMSVTVSSATSVDALIGVVRHATLTTQTYGWVVTRGITPIQMLAASGTVSQRTPVELGANGLFAPVSNTTGNKAGACGIVLDDIVTGASGNAFMFSAFG